MEALTISLFAEIGARSSVDRVLASEAKGRRFDSCRARHSRRPPRQAQLSPCTVRMRAAAMHTVLAAPR